jgi:hypothetical protein
MLASYMGRGAAGASPKNLDLYTYGWNNPIVLRDPDGRETKADTRYFPSGQVWGSPPGGLISTPQITDLMAGKTTKFAQVNAILAPMIATGFVPGGKEVLQLLAMAAVGDYAMKGDHVRAFLALFGAMIPEGAEAEGLASGSGGGWKVLKRDLTGGPHAANRSMKAVIDRVFSETPARAQGRWSSPEAAQRAAAQFRGIKESVPIQPGDGFVVYPEAGRSVSVRETDRALLVPYGDHVHTYPIGPEHPDYALINPGNPIY